MRIGLAHGRTSSDSQEAVRPAMKARSERAGSNPQTGCLAARSLCAILADSQRLPLEGLEPVDRGAGGRSEIGKGYQVLQVVSEAVQDVVECAVVGVILQRVSIFQNSAGSIVAVHVNHEWIVGPLAHLMRQSGDILRERTNMIDIGGMGIGLRIADAAL